MSRATVARRRRGRRWRGSAPDAAQRLFRALKAAVGFVALAPELGRRAMHRFDGRARNAIGRLYSFEISLERIELGLQTHGNSPSAPQLARDETVDRPPP